MAAGNRKSTSGKSKAQTTRRTNSGQKKTKQNKQDDTFALEVILWIVVALSILLFISNFGFGGKVGNAVSQFFFGIFGVLAYIFPVVFLVGIFFGVSNKGNTIAIVKIIAGCLFVAFFCMFLELLATGGEVASPIESYYYAREHVLSGGIIGGFLTWLLEPNFGLAGSYVIDVIILIISLVLLTERSALKWMQKGGKRVYESARTENERQRENARQRREERELRREERELLKQSASAKGDSDVSEEPALRRMDRKAAGVAIDTRILPEHSEVESDELNELHPDIYPDLPEVKEEQRVTLSPVSSNKNGDFSEVSGVSDDSADTFDVMTSLENMLKEEMSEITSDSSTGFSDADAFDDATGNWREQEEIPTAEAKKVKAKGNDEPDVSVAEIENEMHQVSEPVYKYTLPPTSLLAKPVKKAGDSKQHLQETAMKLQQTLKNFGVNVTITNVSCGPSVTRYELQPEMGVKVSKIVNLTDDIKLNLAAADIRMEAPIPGKAAIGIEVPNKENVTVSFRELVESEEFQSHPSKIAFCVGRDIGGKVIVTDIAKMPHLLIAGATGSGKSVCINTIIMSILYKADPKEVKLIMVDPKVVELSVYNGIPHLLIPVVTDPKKAAGALNWAVAEMTDRYNKFAAFNVRDFKGYNAKIDKLPDIEGDPKPEKMPQIVIIVDELADLMMVASGEVEGAICRLAQLARAAGIHLVIATQRPSVNVITGLIKANMPSRIAFAVTSGIDSRTILDMVGAEKLLGKGDMLFNPQGAPKPVRVQGAFVSDNEVNDVVNYIKEENGQGVYNPDIEEKLSSMESGNTTVSLDSSSGGGDGRDSYFVDAAKLLIEKEKGSIGMLQRYFKVGFNRAARIMDQLEEAGVVGPEEGTKPRRVLMTEEQFAQYMEEYL